MVTYLWKYKMFIKVFKGSSPPCDIWSWKTLRFQFDQDKHDWVLYNEEEDESKVYYQMDWLLIVTKQQVYYQMDWLIDSNMAWLDEEIMNVSTSTIYNSSIALHYI